MAQVTGKTAEAMDEIANASVTSGAVDVDGHLQLTTAGGSSIDAGAVVGPTGPQGPIGPPGPSGGAPTGAIMMFGGSVAPAGWIVCDGSAVSRTTFSTLFSAIGTTYGVGDGATTFNVPDFRQRQPRMDNPNIGLKGGTTPAVHAHTIDGGIKPAVAQLSAVTGPDNFIHINRIATPDSWSSDFQIGATGFGVSSDSSTRSNGVKVQGSTANNTAPSVATDMLAPFLNVCFIIKS
jgi:microcystin-dependent protein